MAVNYVVHRRNTWVTIGEEVMVMHFSIVQVPYGGRGISAKSSL